MVFALPLSAFCLALCEGLNDKRPLAALTLLATITLASGAARGDELDHDKQVTIGLQPLSAILTQKFGVEITAHVTEHHVVTFTPYYVYLLAPDYLALIQGDTTTALDHLEGKGVEFGYRYRADPFHRSKYAVLRAYGGLSAIVAEYTLSQGTFDFKNASDKLGAGTSYSRRGFALDVGIDATVLPFFYLAFSLGVEYAWTSDSFEALKPLASTSATYGEGLRPRIGGATGFTF